MLIQVHSAPDEEVLDVVVRPGPSRRGNRAIGERGTAFWETGRLVRRES